VIALLPLNDDIAWAAKAKDLLGKPQPGFTLPDLKETTHSHRDWQGKILVINFWASWCTPCLKEIPMFNRVQKEYAPDGVRFIGIAIDNKQAIETFMKKVPIDYPVLYGVRAATRVVQDYGNSAGVLPFTIFIDRQGIIRRIASGKLSEKYTRESIETML
jgi:thiol-disulfide isomerase/thioredoxin